MRTSHGHYCLARNRCRPRGRAGCARRRVAHDRRTALGLEGTAAVGRDPVRSPVQAQPASAAPPPGSLVHWRDLDPDDVTEGWVTTPVRTVIDCCLDLPFADALSVADSARRAGDGARRTCFGPGSDWLLQRQRHRVARVIAASDARATGPFESCLRAVAAAGGRTRRRAADAGSADGDFDARVDLADEALRIVLEADGREFHTGSVEPSTGTAAATTASSPETGSYSDSPGSR